MAEQAQDEIWGQSPDNLIGSALIFPRGRARRVEGGYRVTGRWPFSSGVDPSSWNLIGAIVHDEEAGITQPRIFLLPASDYTIIDTWHVIGLIGTGSKDVAADDVFVPDYRSVAVEQITGGPNPGSEVNPAVLYRLPAISLFAFCIAGVSLGIAQGAIEYFAETTRTRTSYYTGRNLADFVTLQIHLAEATAITDSARAVMLLDCDEATRIVEDGRVPSLHERARYRRDGAYAATLVHPGSRRLCSRPPAAARSMQETRCSAPFATSCRQCALCPELGHQRRDVRPDPARPGARRDAVTARRCNPRIRGSTVSRDLPAVTTPMCTTPRPRASTRANCAMRSAVSAPG